MGGGRELRELISSFVCVAGILLDELAAPREERGKRGRGGAVRGEIVDATVCKESRTKAERTMKATPMRAS